MISFRRADLFRNLQRPEDPNAQNPLYKNLMMVPNVFGIEDEHRTITQVTDVRAVFGPLVHYHKDGGTDQTMQTTKFLGCRDGYAFFQSSEFAEIVGNPLVLISDNETHGNILSIDKGIFKTDTGEEFKAEDYDSQPSEGDNTIII
jgi:hypothetical protein